MVTRGQEVFVLVGPTFPALFFWTKGILLALVNEELGFPYVSEGLGIMHLTPDRLSGRVTY